MTPRCHWIKQHKEIDMMVRIKGTLIAFMAALPLCLAPLAAQSQEVAPIDVNDAEAELLTELPGIGEAKAEAIVEERDANGPYEDADDLTRVNGIGEATVEGLRDQVEF
jgi:competence protein ComEA